MTQNDTRIRDAVQTEGELLAAIAYAAKAQWGYTSATLEQWRADLTPSPSSLAREPTFVAEIGATVVGWCQLDSEAQPLELAHCWVHPDFQGRGVGRALMAAVVAHLRSSGIGSLVIDADPNAEGFYRAIGARRLGVKPAPIPGDPSRTRPQLVLRLEPATGAA